MNHAPSEDLHNSLLAFQGLAFFKEIHMKASHDQIREYYDDLEGCHTQYEVSEDFQPKHLNIQVKNQQIHVQCTSSMEEQILPEMR